ncbi:MULTISPECIES: hypothetical protein [unclassified Breznakia]|uniref:hypothetical protein n=1 Tax=unclassified Breznakia TaxID=2623764 RepID=UPI002474487C|nr:MULTISPECIES: hypothetical protein [unclassified Breznakia]MDH6367883.1 hypothetical protein [Breznakia sp. PH1-1]MDH6404971.1 hypothetical protein [Breznakia sp. PF1-11]MDH6412686.1 hypothetical protein [Breznakia sp. PFB1-11]MDH6415011.1 hypothetical protein [Breznakia sp. PFB1-14]MDH6417357.1 hypothetical protein [Breznakia sp. PFB1-4]
MRKIDVEVLVLEDGKMRKPSFILIGDLKLRIDSFSKPRKKYYQANSKAWIYSVKVGQNQFDLYNDINTCKWFVDGDYHLFRNYYPTQDLPF